MEGSGGRKRKGKNLAQIDFCDRVAEAICARYSLSLSVTEGFEDKGECSFCF